MERESGTGRVVVLVLPEVNLLDLGGPVQVFDAARHQGAGYRLEYVAEEPGVVSAQGPRLAGLGPLRALEPGDLVLIPGPRLYPDRELVRRPVVDWLRASAERGATFASVCTGAAALGEAGLLDGRRCTTHWTLTDPMRLRYPSARVQDGVLYVHDGPISTSAGFSTGIDLALSIVEREHGPTLTAGVARQLVLVLRRTGGSQQLNPFLRHRAHLHPGVHRVQEHLAQHLAIALGATGSVVTDALAPYEVFARSPKFHVYTVSERRQPVGLTGGPPILPDYSYVDAPRSDVVVVPAVAEPSGAAEAPMRDWIRVQYQAGARVLGVCAGSLVLAPTGILDGRTATSFWSRIDGLIDDYPAVHWVKGQRYVQDGRITTTAGVTSGVVGALRLVEQLAGPAEAERIGTEVAYPQWRLDGDTAIDVHTVSLADAPYAINAAFPWGRPTVGIELADGIGEIDVAARSSSTPRRRRPPAPYRWPTTS